jgi:hypothetical protein
LFFCSMGSCPFYFCCRRRNTLPHSISSSFREEESPRLFTQRDQKSSFRQREQKLSFCNMGSCPSTFVADVLTHCLTVSHRHSAKKNRQGCSHCFVFPRRSPSTSRFLQHECNRICSFCRRRPK